MIRPQAKIRKQRAKHEPFRRSVRTGSNSHHHGHRRYGPDAARLAVGVVETTSSDPSSAIRQVSAIQRLSAMNRSPLLIDLALQGGGSHGAFTWGVLDRLLEERWLEIVAISGTSAGTINAAVLADGWTAGGAEGARQALDEYWRRVSRAATFSPLQRSSFDRLLGRWTLDTSPAYILTDLVSRLLSPYDLNPTGYHPLRKVLVESIDFERLARSPIKLFTTATRVRTGRGHIFRNAEITPDVLLA